MNELNEKLDFKNSNTFNHSIDNLSNSKENNNNNNNENINEETANDNCQSYDTDDEYIENNNVKTEHAKWAAESYNDQGFQEDDIDGESETEESNVKSELSKNKPDTLPKVDLSAEEGYEEYLNEQRSEEDEYNEEDPSLFENNHDDNNNNNKKLPLNATQAIYLQAK